MNFRYNRILQKMTPGTMGGQSHVATAPGISAQPSGRRAPAPPELCFEADFYGWEGSETFTEMVWTATNDGCEVDPDGDPFIFAQLPPGCYTITAVLDYDGPITVEVLLGSSWLGSNTDTGTSVLTIDLPYGGSLYVYDGAAVSYPTAGSLTICCDGVCEEVPCDSFLWNTWNDDPVSFSPLNAVALADADKVFLLQDDDDPGPVELYVWTYPYNPANLISTGDEVRGEWMPHSSPTPYNAWLGHPGAGWISTRAADDGGLLVAGFSQEDVTVPGFLVPHAMLWHVTSGGTVSTIYDGYPVATSNRREVTRVVEHNGVYYCSVHVLVNQSGYFSNEVWSLPGGTFYPNATTDMGGLNGAVSDGTYVWGVGGALDIVRWDPATDTTTVTNSGIGSGTIQDLAFVNGWLVVAWINPGFNSSRFYAFDPSNIGAGGTNLLTAGAGVRQINLETDTGLIFYYSNENQAHYAVELCLQDPP